MEKGVGSKSFIDRACFGYLNVYIIAILSKHRGFIL